LGFHLAEYLIMKCQGLCVILDIVMLSRISKYLSLAVALVLCLQIGFSGLTVSAANSPVIKELNFVFLHGAGGNPCGPQLLADSVMEQIPDYIAKYQKARPGVEVKVDMMNRCYPSDVDVETWAANIADTIDKHFGGRGNLILIGHSMGGKAALYAVAHNVGNLADKTAMVVTIDTPVKKLNDYQLVGGGSFTDFCRASWLLRPGQGVCVSVGSYDSSEDGKWVGQNRHWLAFIAGEDAPLSPQFDYGGFDPYPRDMDDGALPMSAQYADGADVIYYGEYGHSDFSAIPELAHSLASQILNYIFSGTVQCSVLVRDGSWQHKAGLLLGTDYWQDIIGDKLGDSNYLWHWDPSLVRWQEWQDTVEYYPPTYENQLRSRFEVTNEGSVPFFTKLVEARWLSPDDLSDCRLYLRSRAAPQNYIKVSWKIWVQGLLPVGKQRDHYEIEMTAGTPLAAVNQAAWLNDNPRDLRVEVSSRAERPFRWYQARWRVYSQEARQRDVIDEMSVE
jgi:pimeloyl-ACP methyl ester carboxylesterase